MTHDRLSWRCTLFFLACAGFLIGCATKPVPVEPELAAAPPHPMVLVDLSVPLIVKVGHPIIYEVRIKNNTSKPLYNVTYVYVLPAHLRYVSSHPPGKQVGRQIRWPLVRGEEKFEPNTEKVIKITWTLYFGPPESDPRNYWVEYGRQPGEERN